MPFSIGRLTAIEKGDTRIDYGYDRFGRMSDQIQKVAFVTCFSAILALWVYEFPEIRVDVFRIDAMTLIFAAVPIFFFCLQLASRTKLPTKIYWGLLPLSLYLATVFTLTGLLADHFGESRIKPISELIAVHLLEVIYSFAIWLLCWSAGLTLLALAGVYTVIGLRRLLPSDNEGASS